MTPDSEAADRAAHRARVLGRPRRPPSRSRGWPTRHDAEIVAVTLDFGQGSELEALRDRALAAGAVRAHVLDVARRVRATSFVLPALKAGALYDDGRPMTSGARARPLIAQKLVEIAAIEQTTTRRARLSSAAIGRVARPRRSALNPT